MDSLSRSKSNNKTFGYNANQVVFINKQKKKESFIYDITSTDITISDMLKNVIQKHQLDMIFTDRLGNSLSLENNTFIRDRNMDFPIYITQTRPLPKDSIFQIESKLEIMDCKGQIRFIMVYLNRDTVKDLKVKLQKETDLDASEMSLTYDYNALDEDDKLLCECGIKQGGKIKQGYRYRSGKATKFVNVDNEKAAKTYQIAKQGPSYRTYTKNGLILEGKCMNKKCEAHKKYVVVSKGMGSYDAVVNQCDDVCPLCEEEIEAEKCGFVNCMYQISGLKKDSKSKKLKKEVYQNWYGVGEEYRVFDPDSAGKSDWLKLTINTKPNPEKKKQEKFCVVCSGELDEKFLAFPDCRHESCETCYTEISVAIDECPICK